MSISWGAQYPKLKTNLRLGINRLQLLGKKKTEMAMKARTEIADYIAANKPDRARIRVEHIIREDYVVEAFEILEMYCDLLLARFGLIEQMKTLDDGIAEAVISIMWAAPRLATDIAEFKTISDQLTIKYGKPFAEAARANQLEFPARVNPKIISKLGAAAPPKLLVERYMIEIAAAAGVPFVPDPDVMREDEVHQAEQILIDFKNAGGNGPSGPDGPPPPPSNPYGGSGNDNGSSGGGGGYGWNLENQSAIGSGVMPHGTAIGGGVQPVSNFIPPPPNRHPNEPPQGGNIYEVPSRDHYDFPPDAFNEEPPKTNPTTGVINLPKIGPNGLPIYPGQQQPKGPGGAQAYPALSQRNSLVNPNLQPNHPTAPPQSLRKPDDFSDLSFPEPPSSFVGGNNKPGGPGGNNGGGAGNGGFDDFDDLARRFEELKKIK
ncbi:IST1 homolog [Caenorhabditis elegans]|uniref:IST1 homolog n=1 Tax=Caenorhabditis elegans TaxID=6239 RepID=G5EDV6_CAEEL|nr:IST1 homolog [Caenorhabditis elegans]CAN99697.1 IST1 homolog [Caenorhabditis elegans]|eukprot:NP_001122975.1 Increased Sodium Tolerance Related [Caenorhabditis elegans]